MATPSPSVKSDSERYGSLSLITPVRPQAPPRASERIVRHSESVREDYSRSVGLCPSMAPDSPADQKSFCRAPLVIPAISLLQQPPTARLFRNHRPRRSQISHIYFHIENKRPNRLFRPPCRLLLSAPMPSSNRKHELWHLPPSSSPRRSTAASPAAPSPRKANANPPPIAGNTGCFRKISPWTRNVKPNASA